MKPCTKDSAISWPLEEQSHTHSRTFLAFIIRLRSVIVCSALSEGHVTTKEKEANLKKKKKGEETKGEQVRLTSPRGIIGCSSSLQELQKNCKFADIVMNLFWVSKRRQIQSQTVRLWPWPSLGRHRAGQEKTLWQQLWKERQWPFM